MPLFFDLNSYAKCIISSRGKPIVLGGRSGGASSFRSTNVYEFDVSSDRWSPVSSLQDNVAAPMILKLSNSRILVSGGSRSEDATFDLSTMNQSEGYPNFTATAPLSIGRHWHSLVQWNADTVMAIGGHNNNLISMNTVDWIDLRNNQSSNAPQMLEARSVFAAIALPQISSDNRQIGAKILAIAGSSSGTLPTTTIEIFEDTVSSAIAHPQRPIPVITSVLTEASCGIYRLTLQASTGAIIRVEPSIGTNVTVETQTQLPSSLIELTIRLVNPLLSASIPLLRLTDDQNRFITVTITALLTSTISNLVTPILPHQRPLFGDSSSVTTCATILLHNSSPRPIVFPAAYITRNMEFSLPLSQFPIIVPPNDNAPLKICYTPSASEMQYDTIILRHDCSIINIPLSARGAVVSFEGRSRCDAVLSLRSLGFPNNSQMAMSASLPFPHPASNDIEFTLSFTEPTDKSNVIISVQDRLGMEVVTNQIEQSNSHQLLVRVRTDSLTPSVYFARIKKGLLLLTIPFVVMH